MDDLANADVAWLGTSLFASPLSTRRLPKLRIQKTAEALMSREPPKASQPKRRLNRGQGPHLQARQQAKGKVQKANVPLGQHVKTGCLGKPPSESPQRHRGAASPASC